MANTTWSTTDKSASTTLSGGNLIVTSAAVNTWVRAVDKQFTGKFYWELRPTVWASGNTGVGIALGSVTPSGAAPVGMAVVYRTGAIWVNNTNTGLSLGTRANNDIIGFAFDFGAQLAWFRVAPSGNWNGSAGADPATGIGGIPIAFVGGLFSLGGYPVAALGAASEAVTANFGDTAFSGTVPSGFTSGFTAGASPPPNNLFVDGVSREVLVTATGSLLVAGVVREVLGNFPVQLLVSGVAREVVGSGVGLVQVAGLVREVVIAPEGTRVDVSGLVREVVGGTAFPVPPDETRLPQYAVTVNV